MIRRIPLAGLLLAIVPVFFSCEREMEVPADGLITIRATLENETKTTYAEEKAFSWLAGDRIAVAAVSAGDLVLTGFQTASAGASVPFTGTLPTGASLSGQAYYPESFASVDGGTLILTFPEEFTPDPANPLSCVPLIGSGKDGSYAFKTAGSILKLTVSGIPGDATGLMLSHVNETPILSGTFSVPSNSSVTYREVLSSANHVTAHFTPETAGETRSFYFPMAVQTIPAGMVVTLLRSGSGDLPIAVTAHSIELPRNCIVNVSAVATEMAYSSVRAYFPSIDVRSSYDTASGTFTWMAGDEIDVVASLGVNTWQGRRYVTAEEGQDVRFLLADKEETDSLALGKWAFYPSRTSEKAQESGYALGWDIRPNYYPADKERWPDETELITIDLPSRMTYPAENPLGLIPQLGVRQDDFRYGFSPMTGIVSVRVQNMTDELDFISLTGSGALSGSFHLDPATGTISQAGVLTANPDGITLDFSGVGSEATFSFPVPAGKVEGLTVTLGCSSQMDEAMVVTASESVTIVSGGFVTLDLQYEPKDQQWETVGEVSFLDDFIWSKHSAYTADTPVTVTLEHSGLHPNKYRLNNPYTVANAQFGYTPHTDGIVADPYLVYTLNDDGIVRFSPFRLGVEDSDTGGRPMMITHPLDWSSSKKGANNKVVSALADGTPLEIELACIYSDPNDASYMYSRDGEGSSDASRIHIVIPDDTPETWNPVAEGEFIDNLLWPMHSWGTTAVAVTLEQSSKVPANFRVANPYLAAAEAFSYTPTESADNVADYVYITLKDNNLLSFETFNAGIEDKPSGHQMRIWYPSQWGSSYDVSYNKVLEWRSDGLPARFQFAVVYSGTTSSLYSYKYTKNTAPSIFFSFPEETTPEPEENWTEVGQVRYRDLFTFENCPYAAVRMDKSDLGRYRIANPYPVLAGMLAEEVKYTPDEYLYLTIADNGLIDFDPLATGLERYNWDFSISHPSEIDKNVNYNKVLRYDEGGDPLILQLAPIYHQTGAITSGNKYSRDTYDDMVRILMPGVPDKSGLAVVEHVQYPLHAGETKQIMKLSYPAGTVDSWTVTCSHPELVEAYSMEGSGIYVTMKEGPYTALPALTFALTEFTVGGVALEIDDEEPAPHHLAVRVRQGGEDGVASYRIPGLVTSNQGTLIAACDARWANSTDLQGDIDVVVCRSTDGGVTWGPMIVAMDMGEYDGLGQDLNGIGDPCLLVDENTGEIFCFAVWAHGHGGSRCIYWAGTGYEIADTPQLMMVSSKDDGLTWSDPVNLTRQVKQWEWRMTFQGPGRGITMHDGTLVIPMQHQEKVNSATALCSGIMYSTDHGKTWHAHNYARKTTSEAAVAEIEPGVLMLSMRDETNAKTRAVYTTRDLGRTWTPHASDGKVIEPTCEASLLHVDAADNGLGKDILLFSNPHSASARKMMTIQLSYDGGVTWPHAILLDQGGWQGYSCLTMIDKDTVGIVHESESNTVIFQAVPLASIVR